MNRKAIVIALASFSTLAAPAFAEPFGDRARVVSAHPVVERIPVSREECWNDHVRSYEDRQVTRTDTGASIGPGTVLGAVVGGVLGHQVGSGRGNDAATVAGAVGGAVVGNEVEKRRNDDERYRIVVRFRDGREATFEQDSTNGLRVGDRVRVDGNNVYRD